ncbi:hypothetical protein CN918_31640 [Priestia megaterium]|nr:hypothetical protein CN918_31640 [Priestia megaterium]
MKPVKTELPRNASQAAKTRNLGDKRCSRFSVSIQNDYNKKLSKLATSCGMSKSMMADALLRVSLDSPHLIEYFQDIYNKHEEYRIIPRVINDEVYYTSRLEAK